MFSMHFLILVYFFEFLFNCCFNNKFLTFKFSCSLDSKELDRSALLGCASKHKTEVKLVFNFTSALISIFRMQIIFSFKHFNLFSWLST